MIGYLVYFNVELKDVYANSPYNSKRQGIHQERVVKGNILANDGEELAVTVTTEDGTESREYPYGRMFAHVVGYSASGISGLEQQMNSVLLNSHSNMLEQIENDVTNKKSIGDNVVTTLDIHLQKTAYESLGNYDGAVVVMEPDTGKILAMVSKPDFDPNTISSDWENITADESSAVLVNRATQGQYPPGSIFKMITSLAYWRQHNTLNNFHMNCTGEVEHGGFTIHCYKNSAHGEEDFSAAFAKSCNTAFAQIGVDLDKKVYKETVEQLLFNKDLPLDITYRQSRFTLDASSGDPLTMQTAIGQGNTLVTPLHMAMITSAIANGGNMMTPYFVERVETYNGTIVKEYTPKVYEKVMTAQESATLTKLMTGVVESGTATKLAGRGYTAAGKTGTAEHGDVSVTTPHSWFVGFSNVEDPDLVVCVVAEEAGAGSEVAVPIAGKIFDAYYAHK